MPAMRKSQYQSTGHLKLGLAKPQIEPRPQEMSYTQSHDGVSCWLLKQHNLQGTENQHFRVRTLAQPTYWEKSLKSRKHGKRYLHAMAIALYMMISGRDQVKAIAIGYH